MESLTLNVRVDANDKKSFEQFCNSVGKLPFEVKSNILDETI